MKKTITTLLQRKWCGLASISLLLSTGVAQHAAAQCTNTSLYPTSAVSIAHSCTSTTIASDQYAGEYSVLNLTAAAAGEQYVFASSVNTDYLTLRDSTGALLASGITPLYYTQTANPMPKVQLHVNASAACTNQEIDRTYDGCLWQVLMTYSSATTTQSSSSPANTGQFLMRRSCGLLSPHPALVARLSMSSINYDLSTTTSAANITAAKVYYTGSSTTFSTTNLFGSATAPTGPFTVSGSQTLGAGVNYFWLVFDISCTAVLTNVVDANCNSFNIGATNYIPTATSPTGTRAISAGSFSAPTFASSTSTSVMQGQLIYLWAGYRCRVLHVLIM